MTLIFNPEKYKELLFNYQPKLIRNKAENEKALAIVEELMHRKYRSLEEDELYELLIVLIEKFEREYYQPGLKATPHSVLSFLLEQQGLKPRDLVGLIGTEQEVQELINGEESIRQEQALILGKFFHVDPTVFIN